MIQSCINGTVIFGLLRLREKPTEPESNTLTPKLSGLVKYLLIGALIETPLFVWYSKIGYAYSWEFLFLWFYHIIGIAAQELAFQALGPFLSKPALDAVGKAVVFVTQSCVVGAGVYVVRRLTRKMR